MYEKDKKSIRLEQDEMIKISSWKQEELIAAKELNDSISKPKTPEIHDMDCCLEGLKFVVTGKFESITRE